MRSGPAERVVLNCPKSASTRLLDFGTFCSSHLPIGLKRMIVQPATSLRALPPLPFSSLGLRMTEESEGNIEKGLRFATRGTSRDWISKISFDSTVGKCHVLEAEKG